MKKNHLWMFAAILACGLMLTACDNNDSPVQPTVTPGDEIQMPELKEDFETVADWLTAAVKRCHPYINQFWNNDADPADFNLLLTNEECNKVYFIDAEGKREVPQSDWDAGLTKGLADVGSASYYFLTFQGKRCCLQIVSPSNWKIMAQSYEMMGLKVPTLQDNAYDLLHTFYHESFHQYVQKLRNWKQAEGTVYSRDQVYPVVYEPRIYRKLALLALLKAWRDPSQKDAQYARATYWTYKYETEVPLEAEGIRQTDVDESTAEYFCRSIIHAAFNDYELLYDIDKQLLAMDVDGESYQQSLAMQLLLRDNRLPEAMKAVKEDVITPINILLKDVVAPANYDESQDAADIEMIRAAMDKRYTKENPFMAPVAELLERHLGGKAVYVSVVTQSAGGYFSSQGSYKLTDLPGFDCYVNYTTSNEKVDINSCTSMKYRYQEYTFYCLPIATAEHLTLSDWQDISETPSDLPDVVYTRQATLSAVTGEPTFSLKCLPATVMYGKDNYGNEYYVLTWRDIPHEDC